MGLFMFCQRDNRDKSMDYAKKLNLGSGKNIFQEYPEPIANNVK